MSRRTSFHISEQAEKVVAENGDQAKRINFLINACSDLQESPAFTEQEWMILVAAGNGFVPAYSAGLDAILHSFASGIAYAAIFGSEYENIDKEESIPFTLILVGAFMTTMVLKVVFRL